MPSTDSKNFIETFSWILQTVPCLLVHVIVRMSLVSFGKPRFLYISLLGNSWASCEACQKVLFWYMPRVTLQWRKAIRHTSWISQVVAYLLMHVESESESVTSGKGGDSCISLYRKTCEKPVKTFFFQILNKEKLSSMPLGSLSVFLERFFDAYQSQSLVTEISDCD
jgi:hypothetical protein